MLHTDGETTLVLGSLNVWNEVISLSIPSQITCMKAHEFSSAVSIMILLKIHNLFL